MVGGVEGFGRAVRDCAGSTMLRAACCHGDTQRGEERYEQRTARCPHTGGGLCPPVGQGRTASARTASASLVSLRGRRAQHEYEPVHTPCGGKESARLRGTSRPWPGRGLPKRLGPIPHGDRAVTLASILRDACLQGCIVNQGLRIQNTQ